MGCKTIPEQLAIALGKDTVNTSDQLPVVESDTLYRVTVGDFATSLGMTGAITGENGAGATPLLTGVAPNYAIRGIVGSQGIATQVNALGSVTISGQFKDAGTASEGLGIIKNRTAPTAEFRRLQAGDGITLTQNANNIVITNEQVGADNNTVIVNGLNDFPAAVSGVITLADSKNYIVSNDISTSNRFVLGANTVISATDGYSVTLTYTGTGDMFTFTGGLAGVKEIGLRCANGTLFNSDAVTTGNMLFRWLLIYEVKNLGSLQAPNVGVYDIFILLHTGQGFTCGSVTSRRLNMNQVVVVNSTSPTAVFLDAGTATFTSFNVDTVTILASVSGQFFLNGLTGGANLLTDIIGFVSKVTINGDMAGLSVITTSDPGWDFSDNNKIGDSRPIALTDLSATAVTTIAVAATPVVVNGVFTTEQASQFDVSTSGRCTYTGRRPLSADMTATITFTGVSGTNVFTFYIAKNGVPIVNSGIAREVAAANNANMGLVWDVDMATGDFIEVWAENTDGTNNLSVEKLILRVK